MTLLPRNLLGPNRPRLPGRRSHAAIALLACLTLCGVRTQAQPLPSAKADSTQSGFGSHTPDASAEPGIPLPPGFAANAEFAQTEQAAADTSHDDVLATRERESMDGVLLGDGGMPAVESPELENHPDRPTDRPADYFVMFIVFLIPLVLLLPAAWIWYAFRNLHMALRMRR